MQGCRESSRRSKDVRDKMHVFWLTGIYKSSCWGRSIVSWLFYVNADKRVEVKRSRLTRVQTDLWGPWCWGTGRKVDGWGTPGPAGIPPRSGGAGRQMERSAIDEHVTRLNGYLSRLSVGERAGTKRAPKVGVPKHHRLLFSWSHNLLSRVEFERQWLRVTWVDLHIVLRGTAVDFTWL